MRDRLTFDSDDYMITCNRRRRSSVDEQELGGWFAGRVPAEWFEGAP
jgi:hypothetical protein